jgi:hypothetical protein
MLTDQLIETWDIHHRINLYLLDAIKEDHLFPHPKEEM